MTGSGLHLRGGLGGTHATGRVLAADTDTDEESPRGEHVEHADRLALEIGAGSQCGEDDEDDGGAEQRVGARPAVRQVAKGELADDGTGESDGRDVLRRI